MPDRGTSKDWRSDEGGITISGLCNGRDGEASVEGGLGVFFFGLLHGTDM